MQAGFRFEAWPTNYKTITQKFGANPENYAQFGLPGHEGIDIKAPLGTPYYAVAPGTVVWASDERRSGGKSAYGWHCIIEHVDGYSTLYAHAAPGDVALVGTEVAAGDAIGISGNTGNSSGPHLHLTLKREGNQLPGWPPGYMDPWPFLEGLL